MRVLYLTLHRQWFDKIAIGEKKVVFRDYKPYWRKIFEKEYDVIEFKNGYKRDCPTMQVEFKGFDLKYLRMIPKAIGLVLGKVLWIKNWDGVRHTVKEIKQ